MKGNLFWHGKRCQRIYTSCWMQFRTTGLNYCHILTSKIAEVYLMWFTWLVAGRNVSNAWTSKSGTLRSIPSRRFSIKTMAVMEVDIAKVCCCLLVCGLTYTSWLGIASDVQCAHGVKHALSSPVMKLKQCKSGYFDGHRHRGFLTLGSLGMNRLCRRRIEYWCASKSWLMWVTNS